MTRQSVLVVLDKLSMDGQNPNCMALNIRDSYGMFSDAGVDQIVCEVRSPGPGTKCLEEADVPIHCLDRSPISPRIKKDLIELATHHGATLIHAHGYSSTNFARMAAKRLRIPVVVHEHAVLRVRPHQYLVDWLLRRKTTVAIAVSEAVKEFMVRGRAVPEELIRVIYNGTNLAQYRRRPDDEVDAFRAQFDLPPGDRLIGAVTRFREEKGNRYLIEAMRHVLADVPNTQLVLAGDGALLDDLKRRAAEEGVAERVHFPGFVKNIPAFLSMLDVLAIPSLSEGCPFAALEAMANGATIVASRTGGLAEIIEDRVNGLHAQAGSGESLGAALVRVLGDADLSRTLRAGALASADRYSLETYTKNIVGLYQELWVA